MPTFSPTWYLVLLLVSKQIKQLLHATTKPGMITIKVLMILTSIRRIMPDFYSFLEGTFGFIFLWIF